LQKGIILKINQYFESENQKIVHKTSIHSESSDIPPMVGSSNTKAGSKRDAADHFVKFIEEQNQLPSPELPINLLEYQTSRAVYNAVVQKWHELTIGKIFGTFYNSFITLTIFFQSSRFRNAKM